MSDFAKIFTNLRKEHGHTQETIAKALGVSRSIIGMYESGQREPSREALETVADFFNVDIEYLLGRTNKSTYYLNPQTAEIAQALYENPNLRLVFDAAKDLTPEEMLKAAEILKVLKNGQ